jgi:hypothetical protein
MIERRRLERPWMVEEMLGDQTFPSIAAIEDGAGEWQMPWHRGSGNRSRNEFASSISAFSALIRSAFFRGQVRLEAFGLRHLLDTIETTRRCSDRR